ncbi:polyprenyl synthetase family protein [Allokutzneria sp. NRRL B-24872]|uniref:polyprenyl synthetase family protein n=1 Tax=Allokutzneria sp. NRRL B-24872 TaxID=1137961 RepID=UPI000A38A93E|nr:polyprenyl synthetase family protein [Allokutzneria sp. NRRL B-24872]
MPTEAQKTDTTISDSRAAPAQLAAAVTAGLRDRIDAELIAFLETHSRNLVEIGPEAAPLAQVLVDFLRAGGKRLRPLLCYWGWRGAGGADEQAILTAAASLELLHAFALVHDDIMDASDTRRGRPTVHRQFTTLHDRSRWHGDADLFGTGAGILVGDLYLMLSEAMLHQCDLPSHTRNTLRGLLTAMRVELAGGQYLDLVGQAQQEFSTATAARINRYKTAKYTVQRPLQIGGTLAGATPEVLAAYSEFGMPLGEAFQLRDDLLGAFGNHDSTGKSTMDDLRKGKPTWLIASAWHHADPVQRRRISALYGNPDLDATHAGELREIIIATGARDGAERLITTHTERALHALRTAPLAPEARAALRELAHAATTRTT